MSVRAETSKRDASLVTLPSLRTIRGPAVYGANSAGAQEVRSGADSHLADGGDDLQPHQTRLFRHDDYEVCGGSRLSSRRCARSFQEWWGTDPVDHRRVFGEAPPPVKVRARQSRAWALNATLRCDDRSRAQQYRVADLSALPRLEEGSTRMPHDASDHPPQDFNEDRATPAAPLSLEKEENYGLLIAMAAAAAERATEHCDLLQAPLLETRAFRLPASAWARLSDGNAGASAADALAA